MEDSGGGMDQLRARAYLDLLLGKDSRPSDSQPAGSRPAPGGFASRVTLTAPLAGQRRPTALRFPASRWWEVPRCQGLEMRRRP